jgi:flagellar basal body-associated protein FliL
LWKVLIQLFRLLLPIGTENDAHAQHAWRWAVSIVLLVVIICGWVAVLFATGTLFGTGYVQHSELAPINSAIAARAPTAAIQTLAQSITKISTSVNFLTKESIEGAIRDKLTIACKTKDHAFKVELEQEVMQLEDRYYDLTNQGYKQPTCAEL